VGEGLRALRSMYEWTRRLPAPAAVERVLEATGLLAMTSAGSPGGAEAGDLLHAVDRIRQITEEGGTLADAAEALIDDLESAEVESVPLEPPVVFLADPGRGWPDTVDVRVVRDGLHARGYFELTRPRGDFGRQPLGRPEGWEHLQEEE